MARKLHLSPPIQSLSRRQFLEVAGGALALYTTSPLWLRLGAAGAEPAPAEGRKLLLLLLEGGNDGLNTVVPYGQTAYFEKRRTLAYKPEEILKLGDSTMVGLAPTLPKLAKLYEARKVGLVQGVGYDKPNLSHFESMDIWQTGRPKHDLATGWLGRYLDHTPSGASVVRAVAIGNRLPTVLTGAEQSGVAVPSFGGFTFFDGSDADPASEPHRLHEAFLAFADAPLTDGPAKALLASERATVQAVRAIQKLGDPKAGEGHQPPPKQSKPPATLADRVSMAVKLLSSDLGVEIAMVSLGGFDNHAAEKNNHPKLLTEVDNAIDRFMTDAAATGKASDYLLMTFSEFGRRVEEDGSAGTDHGTAAPLFLVGDGVAGGLYGEQPSLINLDNNKNLIRTVDFREVYATVLDGWLRKVPAAEVLGTKPADGLHPVGFLR
ncbi:MAG TPA: DUF1501 domain-containing protein [Acidimicrobiia bacterium]|jgi:uncharacterized protein (DUF1501 family)|nr:DUF1501 domain-containing protein [Acidimicrobiia bacterium]